MRREDSEEIDRRDRNVYVNTITGSNIMNNGVKESQQYLVDISTKKSIFKRKGFYRNVSITLLIVIILLIIALIVITTCYVKTAKYYSMSICTSGDCLRSASNLRLSMDLSVDPCEDFYNYTCGKWTEEHINHGWYSRFSTFETINERVIVSTLNFLNSNESKSEPLPVKQSRDLYKSCMNLESINKLGYSVIFKYLKLIELPSVPKIFNATEQEVDSYQFDWIKADVNSKKMFATDLFVQFLVDADIFNRSQNVMFLGSSRATSPLPSPFKKSNYKKNKSKQDDKTKNEDEDETYEKTYKNVAKVVMRIIVGNVTKAPDEKSLQKIVDLLWNVTETLSDLAGDDDDYESDEEEYYDFKKMKISELQNLTTTYLKRNNLDLPHTRNIWENYIKLLYKDLPEIKLDLNGNDLIHFLPSELDYLINVVLFLTESPGVAIELYAWYQAVYSMIINTTTEIVNFIYNQVYEGKTTSVLRTRSMSCADNVVLKFMGVAVSYGIVDKTFLNATKPKVETMLKNIKDAFVERVKKITWMDDETKDATLEKSSEMVSFIGFPEWLLNKTALEIYYDGIIIKNDTYLENMISVIREYVRFTLGDIRRENPRTWRTDPITVNAYNYFGDNSINVPIAILSFPIYHLGLEVLNYGAMGSVLGHELTHGFDNTGRKFDKYGNYIQWWSNETIETFETKTKCFVEQYNNYTLPNIDDSVNGKMTLGENLADNGGLNHAFLAYKNYVKKNGKEKLLPGFENYSHEQLFFIAYANVYCETPTRESLVSQLKTDEHSPNSVRVIGTLHNSDDFVKAFKCPRGSKMNPKKEKCRIW
ncbi:neprilysin [Onthophagus taurus]|uniref:neprilysin n=1 Tax=Onthophagus taurus TaxID=166361 RepID=UPI0039BEB955